jgi:hypothetical protein
VKYLYETAAEELRRNAGQWAAYESRGHSVILAGPGSGKTKVLTRLSPLRGRIEPAPFGRA